MLFFAIKYEYSFLFFLIIRNIKLKKNRRLCRATTLKVFVDFNRKKSHHQEMNFFKRKIKYSEILRINHVIKLKSD